VVRKLFTATRCWDAIVEAYKLRVKVGHVGSDDEPQRFAVELARFGAIIGRFCLVAILAPQIHFITYAAAAACCVGVVRVLIDSGARTAGSDAWIERRTGNLGLRSRLVDAVQRRFEIEILRQSQFHQLI
jgi:hypothetical protein